MNAQEIIETIKTNGIMTHGGVFHADEVLSTALLQIVLKDTNLWPQRVFEVPNDTSCFVYDIGRGEFDHHQAEVSTYSNGKKKAAFGLICEKIIPYKYSQEVYDNLLDFIMDLDECDNYGKLERTKEADPICEIIDSFNVNWNSNEDNEEAFKKAVVCGRTLLEKYIEREASKLRAKEVVKNAKREGCILFLEQYLPWRDFVENEIKYVVYPSLRGGYNIQTNPNIKNLLPQKWLFNKPEGCLFVHNGLFLAQFESIEKIKEAIQKKTTVLITTLSARGTRINNKYTYTYNGNEFEAYDVGSAVAQAINPDKIIAICTSKVLGEPYNKESKSKAENPRENLDNLEKELLIIKSSLAKDDKKIFLESLTKFYDAFFSSQKDLESFAKDEDGTPRDSYRVGTKIVKEIVFKHFEQEINKINEAIEVKSLKFENSYNKDQLTFFKILLDELQYGEEPVEIHVDFSGGQRNISDLVVQFCNLLPLISSDLQLKNYWYSSPNHTTLTGTLRETNEIIEVTKKIQGIKLYAENGDATLLKDTDFADSSQKFFMRNLDDFSNALSACQIDEARTLYDSIMDDMNNVLIDTDPLLSIIKTPLKKRFEFFEENFIVGAVDWCWDNRNYQGSLTILNEMFLVLLKEHIKAECNELVGKSAIEKNDNFLKWQSLYKIDNLKLSIKTDEFNFVSEVIDCIRKKIDQIDEIAKDPFNSILKNDLDNIKKKYTSSNIGKKKRKQLITEIASKIKKDPNNLIEIENEYIQKFDVSQSFVDNQEAFYNAIKASNEIRAVRNMMNHAQQIKSEIDVNEKLKSDDFIKEIKILKDFITKYDREEGEPDMRDEGKLFHYIFEKHGISAPEKVEDNEIWIDLGNRADVGVFDHHQDEKYPSSFDILVKDIKYLDNAIKYKNDNNNPIFYVHMHESPDMDSIASAFLIKSILCDSKPNAKVLTTLQKYVNDIDAGKNKNVSNVNLYSYVCYLGEDGTKKKLNEEEKYRKNLKIINEGIELFEQVAAKLEERDDIKLYEDPLEKFIDKKFLPNYDYVAKKIKDIKTGYDLDRQRKVVKFETITINGKEYESAIWQDLPMEEHEYLLAREEGAEITVYPSQIKGVKESTKTRVIIAVNPDKVDIDNNENILNSLAEELEKFEQMEEDLLYIQTKKYERNHGRYRVGKDEDRFNKAPFSKTDDPWYFSKKGDIIDTPRIGSNLSYSTILSIISNINSSIEEIKIVNLTDDSSNTHHNLNLEGAKQQISNFREGPTYPFVEVKVKRGFIAYNNELLKNICVKLVGENNLQQNENHIYTIDYQTLLYTDSKVSLLISVEEQQNLQEKISENIGVLLGFRKRLLDLRESLKEEKESTDYYVKAFNEINYEMNNKLIDKDASNQSLYSFIQKKMGIDSLKECVNDSILLFVKKEEQKKSKGVSRFLQLITILGIFSIINNVNSFFDKSFSVNWCTILEYPKSAIKFFMIAFVLIVYAVLLHRYEIPKDIWKGIMSKIKKPDKKG